MLLKTTRRHILTLAQRPGQLNHAREKQTLQDAVSHYIIHVAVAANAWRWNLVPEATLLLTSTEELCRLGVALAVPPSSNSLGPGYKHAGGCPCCRDSSAVCKHSSQASKAALCRRMSWPGHRADVPTLRDIMKTHAGLSRNNPSPSLGFRGIP